jgi:hypothetical protein
MSAQRKRKERKINSHVSPSPLFLKQQEQNHFFSIPALPLSITSPLEKFRNSFSTS